MRLWGQGSGYDMKDQQGLGWKLRWALGAGRVCLTFRRGAGVWTEGAARGRGRGQAGAQAGTEPGVPTVGGLGPGTHQEEAPGGPVLRADVTDRGHAQEDAAHRPEYVCPHRPGAHHAGQDPLCPGACSAPFRELSTLLNHTQHPC